MSDVNPQLATALADKLPVFDPLWPNEWQALWLGWMKQVMAIGRGAQRSRTIFSGTSLSDSFAAPLPLAPEASPPSSERSTLG